MKKFLKIILMIFIFSSCQNNEKIFEEKNLYKIEKDFSINQDFENCLREEKEYSYLCLKETIKNLKIDFIKNCIYENINSNKNFSEKFEKNILEIDDFKSIIFLYEECSYEFEFQKNKNIKIFPDFKNIKNSYFLGTKGKDYSFIIYFLSKGRKEKHFVDENKPGFDIFQKNLEKIRNENLKKYKDDISENENKGEKYLLEKYEAEENYKNLKKEEKIKKDTKIIIIKKY